MAAPMRDGPLDSGHRVKVADPRTAAAKAAPTAAAAAASNNFEYDDNEWDIGIGDLIIDLDADIEKTNEKSGGGALSVGSGGGLLGSTGVMASAGTGSTGKGGKMAVEHSATVDKGLKMKIKRTKPGTKTSEAKHEIVKSGEQNGSDAGSGDSGKGKHPGSSANSGTGVGLGGSGGGGGSGSSKRGSSGHRRDKARDKHGGEKSAQKPATPSGSSTGAVSASPAVVVAAGAAAAVSTTPPDVNGVVRGASAVVAPAAVAVAAAAATTTSTTVGAATAQQATTLTSASSTPAAGTLPTTVTTTTAVAGAAGPPPPSGHPLTPQTAGQPPQQQRVVFPVSSGPGPPAAAGAGAANTPGPPAVPASPAAGGAAPAMKAETPCKAAEVPDEGGGPATPPPAKKLKTEPKDMLDVCVGTSVGTITEPDCLGPCEPGTSVTLEGIVWHETEGGVLVVNVTWRGKTYVGTLLDCTRHDWAPPRFCDSPTSDLDARTPKGRGKRGRAAASASPGGDLSNFTETRSSVHSKLRNGGAKGRRGGNANAQPGGATVGANVGTTTTAGTGSPTPFVPPRPESSKRKGRTAEESESPGPAGKKTRAPASSSASPPASPVLLECPEPNCSKKYKHINGLKYHQSHAHGCVDDEDTKDAASLSENDESNVETPSPAPPAKSPEKVEPPAVAPAVAAAAVTATVASTVTTTTVAAAATTTTTLTTPGEPPGASAPLPVPAASGTPPALQPVLPPPLVVPATQQAPTPMTPTQPPLPPPLPPPAVVGAAAAAATVPPLPKKEEGLGLAMVPGLMPVQPSTPEQPTQPNAPKSGVVSPTTPLSSAVPAATPAPHSLPTPPELVPAGATPLAPMPSPDAKNVVKPGVLRFGPPPADEYPMGAYCASKQPASVGASGAPISTIRAVSAASSPGQAPGPVLSHAPSQPTPSNLPPSIQQHNIPSPQVLGSQPLTQMPPTKPQFKVKSTASLMPDDKKDRNKIPGHKKKSRKSPAGSPHPQPEQPSFGMDASVRDDVQSPAYSDISDDAAPVLESEVGDGKNKGPVGEKKTEVGQGPSPHTMPHYGMYPFYGQPPYLVPSVQQDGKTKDASGDKVSDNKIGDKDKKDGPTPGEYPQKLLQQHYYPYGYVPGYPYNLEPSYPMTVMPPEDKAKEPIGKDDKSPSPAENLKPAPLVPSPIQVPNPNKIKTEPGVGMKEKHQNENHQIIKESLEIKNQMHPYSYQRPHITQPPPQQVPQTAQVSQQPSQAQSQQQQEELRRYYLYPEQPRRKETSTADSVPKNSSAKTLASPSHKHKEKQVEEKKEDKVKQEGVKPTMETQGPPPPPTSSYAYIHHAGYMQAPHYGALPFDPAHPMYRSMLVPGPYGANPYLHPQLPRYPHAPEDLSRPPSGPPKTLDLLQHHANQYYSSHKIHELQERALKSPTPKPVASSASPSAAPPVGGPPIGAPPGAPGPTQGPPPVAGGAGAGSQVAGVGKPSAAADGKDARSPPPQRHVHTHHHTHVGLGYPILAGQYPAPYGAAVLASQQAAAVAATVINPYPPK